MKKPLFVSLVLSLMLSACLPAFLQQPAARSPQADIQATAAVMASTMAAQTIAALPSATPVLAVPNALLASSATPTPTASATLNPVNTATVTSTATNTSTATPTTPSSTPILAGSPVTATETLHPRYYGTLPPKVPYGSILVVNKAKAEAYISLQNTRSDGSVSILEFPVKGSYGVDAPAGQYIYVAWVGGKKMQGSFKLDGGQDMRITLFKDQVSIK